MMKSEDPFHRDEEVNDDESEDPSGRTEPTPSILKEPNRLGTYVKYKKKFHRDEEVNDEI